VENEHPQHEEELCELSSVLEEEVASVTAKIEEGPYEIRKPDPETVSPLEKK